MVDGAFWDWWARFSTAAEQWSGLVPRGIVGTAAGGFFVPLFKRTAPDDGEPESGLPSSRAEWEALGWEFVDGVRSARPTPREDTELAVVALRLAELGEEFDERWLGVRTANSHGLLAGLAAATEALRESPDPATLGQRAAIEQVERGVDEIRQDAWAAARQQAEDRRRRAEQLQAAEDTASALLRKQEEAREARELSARARELAGDIGARRILRHFLANGNEPNASGNLKSIAQVSKSTFHKLLKEMADTCRGCASGGCGVRHVGLLVFVRHGVYRASPTGLAAAREQREGRA